MNYTHVLDLARRILDSHAMDAPLLSVDVIADYPESPNILLRCRSKDGSRSVILKKTRVPAG